MSLCSVYAVASWPAAGRFKSTETLIKITPTAVQTSHSWIHTTHTICNILHTRPGRTVPGQAQDNGYGKPENRFRITLSALHQTLSCCSRLLLSLAMPSCLPRFIPIWLKCQSIYVIHLALTWPLCVRCVWPVKVSIGGFKQYLITA